MKSGRHARLKLGLEQLLVEKQQTTLIKEARSKLRAYYEKFQVSLRGNRSAIDLKVNLELNFNLPDINTTIFLVVVKLVWV